MHLALPLPQRRRPAPEYRALGPDIYDGSVGVGLFLAEVAEAEGDRRIRGTAIGAASHAASRLDLVAVHERLGFHAGTIGIAVALAQIGATLDDERLVARGAALACEVLANAAGSDAHDVVSGRAGGIVGLLQLARLLDDDRLVTAAESLGDDLIDCARLAADLASWPAVGYRASKDPVGLAHGAGGIGWALLELAEATGADRFRATARSAFAYDERSSVRAIPAGPTCEAQRRRRR